MVIRVMTLSEKIKSIRPEGQDIRKFIKLRWKNGVECPYCNCHNICEFRDGERFKCKDCHKIFSFKIGTPFEGSRLPLDKWFKALRLLKQDNISSIKLGKELKVTQKTAWYMIDRLKNNNNVSYLEEWV